MHNQENQCEVAQFKRTDGFAGANERESVKRRIEDRKEIFAHLSEINAREKKVSSEEVEKSHLSLSRNSICALA